MSAKDTSTKSNRTRNVLAIKLVEMIDQNEAHQSFQRRSIMSDPIPKITRDRRGTASASMQVKELHSLWRLYNDTKHSYQQTEITRQYAEETGTGIISSPVSSTLAQKERAGALPVLKLAVLEGVERLEKLPQKALATLTPDEHLDLRWVLYAIRKERTREAELAEIQTQHQVRERDNDRSR